MNKKKTRGEKAKKRERLDVDSLPEWAQDYISKLHTLTNGVRNCESCGGIHLTGYVCGCGHDSTYPTSNPVPPLVLDGNIWDEEWDED